ncbi:SMI1/KNR4 family protein [Hymenobacter actinosclerus]|uniref:SMI1 / KNR4 family (SUKH-1) n=1 Tax=Hymenobacter actinosclerus TaxID=82805 RepID=A0A1I0FM06_9BACT|nr:SMI1/KNR4 family protein [Hymenobacter actinosclerus]SET59263.1 SMI1 / KNR4 family (SUKH-1) [Hymenobacter actinosclerus]
MWYDKFTFFNKQPGLDNQPSEDFFIRPTTDDEFKSISEYAKKPKEDFLIPSELRLPLEYIQLLKYSNGGGIINGEREFGYFGPETIREMYIGYGFLIWAPQILPIAFNGGGKFYTYDFRKNPESPSLYLVPSGSIGHDEDCVFLGDTLEEVLSKTTNVEDELYIPNPNYQPSEKEKLIELKLKLIAIKEDKDNGKINLKYFINAKRQIEDEIKIFNTRI